MGTGETMLGSGCSPASKCSVDFVQLVCFNARTNCMRAEWFLRCSNIPGWKHLIDSPLTTDERVSLIAGLFSDRDETESLKGLGGGDAQSFIDVIHEVLLHSHVRMTGPLT